MRKIKINRAKWRTGGNSQNKTGIGPTKLINEFGFKCCLGFISCQVTRGKIDEIKDYYVPDNLGFVIPNLSEFNNNNCIRNTELTRKAVCINDSSTTPQKKEKDLKRLFKNIYKLEFFGEYTKNE